MYLKNGENFISDIKTPAFFLVTILKFSDDLNVVYANETMKNIFEQGNVETMQTLKRCKLIHIFAGDGTFIPKRPLKFFTCNSELKNDRLMNFI
jgi:hypothetical protein